MMGTSGTGRKSDAATNCSPSPRGSKPGIDLESRLTDEHHQSLKLWLRLLSCTMLIEHKVRSRLRSEFGTTLARFDLMSQLERHPEGLRMGELSRRLMVTGGNITGITNQLERENMVVRVPDRGDRRAYSVKLTPGGHRAFARMAVVHEQWISELLGGLTEVEKSRLMDLLSRIKRQVAASEEEAAGI